MYIIKNAYRNIVRSIGRNVLIGIIITSITIASCVTITIYKSGNALVKTYKDNNPLKITLRLDTMSFRGATDSEKEDFNLLDLDTIEQIGDMDDVTGYYYTLTNYLNSDSIEAVNYDDLFKKPSDDDNEDNGFVKGDIPEGKMNNKMQSKGDYTIISYSDISYNEDFINGNKKIIDGEMIDKNNTEDKIVISEELATENDLNVGDKITFNNTYNNDIIYELEIVGIYEVNNDSFKSMTPGRINQPSSNQIISNQTILNKIINDNGEVSDFEKSNNINAVFYIKNENLNSFTKNVKYIGVSDYYKINTNDEEILATLKPIQNIASFSLTFLIVVLIVGGVVLTIINLFNIRERKYEIGVLRAIGMTKLKVTLQLVTEVFIIALISLVLGTVSGSLLSQPVSNTMLKSEIESMNNQSQQINDNFGGKGDFQRPTQGNFDTNKKINNKVDYVETLKVHTDYITILELFGVSLLLTIISGSIAVMYVNKFEPNKILQNRN